MIVFTVHSRVQMAARQISEARVLEAVERPHQTIWVGGGRLVNQNRYFDAIEMKEMMLRVFVEPSENNLIAVSVYRTSRIGKYWMEEPQA